jgi:hypothetical protein
MKPAGIVRERARQIVLDGFVDRVEVGENRLDSRCGQVLLRSPPHAARDEDGNSGERRGHCSVLVVLVVGILLATVFVRTLPPGVMAGLIDPVSFDDPPFVNPDDLIVERPPEMRADRDAVVSDKREYAVFVFH